MKKADMALIAVFLLLICAEGVIKYDPFNNTPQTAISTVNTQTPTNNQQTSIQSSDNQGNNVNTNSRSTNAQNNYFWHNSQWDCDSCNT